MKRKTKVMKTHRHWLLIVLFLSLVAFPLAACGIRATPAGKQPDATKPPELTKSPLADKQTLTTNKGSEPNTIDPQKASWMEEVNTVMRVFENLLTFDSKGNLVPAAAEKYTISPDGKVYTFTLRKGLKYSDGQPLTAKNFEYAWKRHMDPAVAGDYAFTGYEIVGAEEYNTADPTKELSRNNFGVLW